MPSYTWRCNYCDDTFDNHANFIRHRAAHRHRFGRDRLVSRRRRMSSQVVSDSSRIILNSSNNTPSHLNINRPLYPPSHSLTLLPSLAEEGIHCLAGTLRCGQLIPWTDTCNLYLLQPSWYLGLVIPKDWDASNINQHLPCSRADWVRYERDIKKHFEETGIIHEFVKDLWIKDGNYQRTRRGEDTDYAAFLQERWVKEDEELERKRMESAANDMANINLQDESDSDEEENQLN